MRCRLGGRYSCYVRMMRLCTHGIKHWLRRFSLSVHAGRYGLNPLPSPSSAVTVTSHTSVRMHCSATTGMASAIALPLGIISPPRKPAPIAELAGRHGFVLADKISRYDIDGLDTRIGKCFLFLLWVSLARFLNQACVENGPMQLHALASR